MESLDQNNMKSNIAEKIFSETKRLNNFADSGLKPSAEEVESIPLKDFREAFEDQGDDFLSEELLNRVLDNFKNSYDSLKENFPEGSRVLIAAFPCNINGTIFPEEIMKKGGYLTNLFIDKKSGLSIGFGALRPTTHARMLPKEIQEQCSFTVHYDSKVSWADKKDFEKFAEQYSKAFHELKRLLKTGN